MHITRTNGLNLINVSYNILNTTVAKNSCKSHRMSRLRVSRSTERMSSVVAVRNECSRDVNASVAATVPVFVLSRLAL